MKRSLAGHHEQMRRAGLALRAACCVGRRHGLAVALALLVALLNPALCVLHCALLHGAHGAALGSPTGGLDAHAHHAGMGHGAADHTHHPGMGSAPVAGDGPAASLCDLMGQPEGAGQPMPRALYELAPMAALLLALAVLPLHAPAGAAPAARGSPRLSPPTPPPRPLALA